MSRFPLLLVLVCVEPSSTCFILLVTTSPPPPVISPDLSLFSLFGAAPPSSSYSLHLHHLIFPVTDAPGHLSDYSLLTPGSQPSLGRNELR